MKVFVDASKCSGCRFCELVCSFAHERKFSYRASRITVIKENMYGLDFPVLCRQCNPCPCINACPTQAIRRNDLGVVTVLKDKCVKCGVCVENCLFGAVKMHPENGFPIICDLCNGDPVCVKKCPTKALTFSDSGKQAFNKGYVQARKVYAPIFRRWKVNVK